jgi:hypothetical protein
MRRLVHPLVAVLVTFWVWGDPAHRVLGRLEGELRDHLWVSWLVQERVLHDHALPLFFPQANYPTGLLLYPLDPLNQLALLLLSPLGLLPSYALLAFVLLILVGHGAARLAAACGASPWASTWAGVLTMLGPPILGVFADTQTEGMGSGWATWTLATVLAPGPWTPRRAVRLGLLAGATVLSAPYQAHALALVGVPIAAWRLRHHLRLALLALLIAAPAGTLALVGLWHAETHAQGQVTQRSRGDTWPPRTVGRGAAVPPRIDQVSAITPAAIHPWPREARYLPPTTGPRRDVGWVLPVLVLLALRERRARPLVAMALLYASLAVGSARDVPWTALGDTRVPLPFDLFWRWFPLGHLSWKPQQYAVLAWAAGCAAVAVAPRSWLALLALLELQVRGPTPVPLPATEVLPLPVFERLAELPDGGVLEFPSRARGRLGPETLPADELLNQLTHHHPIGEPFGRGFNRSRQSVADALAGVAGWMPATPAPAAALSGAARAGFRYLVVHGGALTDAERDALLPQLPGTPTPFPDGTLLYELTP